MKTISKHFVSDEASQLVLEPNDWSKEQFQAFLDIFGLSEAKRIVVSEYKIEAVATLEATEDDWSAAYDHLNALIKHYTYGTQFGTTVVNFVLTPLKRRYDNGERTKELYNAIMRQN